MATHTGPTGPQQTLILKNTSQKNFDFFLILGKRSFIYQIVSVHRHAPVLLLWRTSLSLCLCLWSLLFPQRIIHQHCISLFPNIALFSYDSNSFVLSSSTPSPIIGSSILNSSWQYYFLALLI